MLKSLIFIVFAFVTLAPAVAQPAQCRSIAFITKDAKVRGAVLAISRDKSAIANAIAIYNKMPGDQVAAADGLLLAGFKDGSLYLGFIQGLQTCQGLTIKADGVATVMKQIFGVSS